MNREMHDIDLVTSNFFIICAKCIHIIMKWCLITYTWKYVHTDLMKWTASCHVDDILNMLSTFQIKPNKNTAYLLDLFQKVIKHKEIFTQCLCV